MAAFDPNEVTELRPLRDGVIVADMKFHARFTAGGIALLSDDGKLEGIRPRWAKVYAIGEEQKDVTVGQWILIAHGRWTRGLKIREADTGVEHVIRRIDCNDILAVSDEEMFDETMGRPL